VPNYVEPFAGSLAVLLARPEVSGRRTETVNDLDGFVANFWRAIATDPDAVAAHADWPVNENDLHARHAYLVGVRERFTARLEGDPEWFDVRVAGWWVWGACAWIGSGWCSGDGPWGVVGEELVNRKLPHLGDAGQGITEWFRDLASRLRSVRVCSGDWRRVLTESVTARHGTTGILLDPPYSDEIEQTRVYAIDSIDVAHDVRAWCVENGNDRRLRIALCGYAGEGHDELTDYGWTVHRWRGVGYSAGRGTTGDTNRERETVWFSPGCIAVPEQGDLFGEVTA
jgi:hypothetical protein